MRRNYAIRHAFFLVMVTASALALAQPSVSTAEDGNETHVPNPTTLTLTAAPTSTSLPRVCPAALAMLQEELTDLFSNPSFSNAQWGAAIYSLDSGEPLFTLNEDKGFLPASNMKLFTTAAALDRLGPDFRYETRLFSTDAALDDGVVNGDLVVVGSGDPTFSARFHGGNPLAPFEAWAKTLRDRGITRIAGDIVGDDNVFDDESVAEGWNHSYLTDWYAAQVNGLCLNDNCQDFFIEPGKSVGSPVRWRVFPEGLYGETVFNAQTTTTGSASLLEFHRQANTNTVQLAGKMALGARVYKEAITVHNPTLFFTHHLKRVLENAGIEVTGSPQDADDRASTLPTSMTLLATYQSPPLSKIIGAINKDSQNLYSEQLLKTLASQRGQPGSFKGGFEVVKQFLKRNNIDTTGFYMADGSGLSRMNLLQPRQTLVLLEAMSRHPFFPVFQESLPVAGVDGSIGNRMRETQARGNVRAKTGMIKRVVALSGYASTPDGETIVFSIMANNFTVSERAAKRVVDRAAERLASFRMLPEGKGEEGSVSLLPPQRSHRP